VSISVAAFLGLIAVVLGVVGGGLLWWRARVGGRSSTMADTPTTPAAEVGRLAPGTLVEVTGALRTRQPLTAEFTGRPCAYFRCHIERWTTFSGENENGMPTHHRGRATMYANSGHADCVVQDHSGWVALDFDGATVEAFEVLDEPVSVSETGSLLADVALDALRDTRSSYRRSESILIPDLPVYVLGEVRPGGRVGRPGPGSPNRTFVISYRTEEQRAGSASGIRGWILAAAVVCFLGTAFFLLLAYLLRRF
jgi:hypothetical protein